MGRIVIDVEVGALHEVDAQLYLGPPKTAECPPQPQDLDDRRPHPEVAQACRLGQRIPDKIQHIYSHVAPEVEARLIECLQRRWTDALAALAAPSWATAVSGHRALPAQSTPKMLSG